MANFDVAYKIVAHNEGGYSNDKADKGAQTVFGLTRRDWPHWSGWTTVDHFIDTLGLSKAIPVINSNQQLKDSVKHLFKVNYWDTLLLDEVHDQQIANQIFDSSINQGSGMAAKFMQQAGGVTVDLHVGAKTIAAVNSAVPNEFYTKFIALRRKRYNDIIAANPSQAKFRNSWFSRLDEPYKQA